jgi:hypothetical protein
VGAGGFIIKTDLKLVMAPGLDSSMMCGVGIMPSR